MCLFVHSDIGSKSTLGSYSYSAQTQLIIPSYRMIERVLPVGSYTEIARTIIELIPIQMIYRLSRFCAGDQPMH
jgi:hypothetical protein